MTPTHYQVTFDEVMNNAEHWRDTLYKNKILVLKGLRDLSKDRLWELHTAFGKPWTDTEYADSCEAPSCETPGRWVTTYSNVASKARIGDKDLPWHHDIPWHREKRYPIRSLYPTRLEATKGTTTNFCDADSIWQRIPKEQWEELAQADIRIQFWYEASKGAENPPTKIVPLVERHPHTGRHSLLLNSFGPKHEQLPFSTSYTGAWILDCWSKRKRLGLKYLNHLHEKVCTPDNIYEHEWELGDLVLFDNYSGVFHGRDRIVEANTIREFWRMNLRHYWQTKESA